MVSISRPFTIAAVAMAAWLATPAQAAPAFRGAPVTTTHETGGRSGGDTWQHNRGGRRHYHGTRASRGYYNCRRGHGTTGLIVGGAAGALLGRELDGGRNRATGTIVGAAGGALVGREIQRNRRCR